MKQLVIKKLFIFGLLVTSFAMEADRSVQPVTFDQIPVAQRDDYIHFFNTGNASKADLSYLDLRYAVLTLHEIKGPDFRLSFTYADLSRVNFLQANLRRANFLRIKGVGAYFARANLAYANFCEANLSKAVFIGANLIGANLRGANLAGASFAYADLTGADLTGAIVSPTNFSHAILTGVIGLN